MDASSSKKIFTLALAAVFVASIVPAYAGEGVEAATGFDLQLEEALSDLGDELSLVDLEFDAGVGETAQAESVQIAALSSEAVSEMWKSQEVSAQTTTGSGATGKKWWKKKKWWVSALVAVVAGAALSGGDGDNNIDDEED